MNIPKKNNAKGAATGKPKETAKPATPAAQTVPAPARESAADVPQN